LVDATSPRAKATGIATLGAVMCSDNGEHDASENPKEINKDGHGRTIGERIAEFCLYTIFGSQNRFRMEPYILKPRRSFKSATGEFGK
jgi:hypothetical protein